MIPACVLSRVLFRYPPHPVMNHCYEYMHRYYSVTQNDSIIVWVAQGKTSYIVSKNKTIQNPETLNSLRMHTQFTSITHPYDNTAVVPIYNY